jgi:arabinogalactan endo-1,4-beta-galactosidase
MLWPRGQVNNNNFTAFSQLLNSGIRAIRDFSVNAAIKPRIILHVAQLQNADWWINNVTGAGTTDFDILGISHYPNYSSVNNMSDIANTIGQLKTKYNKQVMIVETAYWWNDKGATGYATGITPLGNYPFTPAMQYQYLKDLVQAVINGGGTGVQYWAPDYLNNTRGGEMTARSLFDFNGNTLPGIDFMTWSYRF